MIRLFVVGKLRTEWARIAQEDFRRRITRFQKIEVIEIADSDPDREGKQMLARVGRERLISFDRRGENWSSQEFARRLGQYGSLSFAIGGPDGLSASILDRAEESLAFGRITLPHELARVTALEQIYRGFTILKGHPYHR